MVELPLTLAIEALLTGLRHHSATSLERKLVNIVASNAYSGIKANLVRMDASTSRIAGQTTDPLAELVEQLDIKTSFDANIAVLRTAEGMERQVVRLWA